MATDLLIVTDATGSMSSYLASLRSSMPEIIHISELTGCFERIAVIAYHDYDDCYYGINVVSQWSGWYYTKRVGSLEPEPEADEEQGDRVSLKDLLDFVDRLDTGGGGDYPEATKSGLSLAYHKTRADAETIVLLYTDAPPHTSTSGGEHYLREKMMLGLKGTEDEAALLAVAQAGGVDKHWVEKDLPNRNKTQIPPYGEHDASFIDWISATKMMASRTRVFCMVENMSSGQLSMYTYLSEKTGGACFGVPGYIQSTAIAAFSVALVLAVMGVTADEKGPKSSDIDPGAAGWRAFQSWVLDNDTIAGWSLKSFKDKEGIDNLTDEDDTLTVKYMHGVNNLRVHALDKDTDAVDLHKYLPVTPAMTSTKSEVTDPAKRYKTDPAYRAFVTAKLEEILKDNAVAVTRNPVFGSLWRAVCSDRQNDAHSRLLNLFSTGIDNIRDTNDKAMARTWLDNSYDYVGDILEILDSVPVEESFPCVYLDPTQVFSDDDILTRDELLEISRSCDGRILSRVGRVLTRLSYAASADDLPLHIKTAVDANVRDPTEPGFLSLIPLSLAQPETKEPATKESPRRGRTFWRILLHTIVPGTMLSTRPGALVAALSLRMGIAPLRDIADRELVLACKANLWNNLEIPETWNASCLNLLLAADADYTARGGSGSVLSAEDRLLFSTLVDYKHLESNLVSTLTARVGWTPAKTKAPLGPTVVCRVCQFPRSVSMMAKDGECGLCCDQASCDDPKNRIKSVRTAKETARMVLTNVSATDSADTPHYWVECGVRQCRAQYVVYNPNLLQARPKCWYCRRDGMSAGVVDTDEEEVQKSSSPTVECNKCLSRILWPTAYRPENFDEVAYECSACTSGSIETVVDTEVTARALEAENGTAWLLRNDNNKIARPFNDRSVFHTVKKAGVEGFTESVSVFPLEDYASLKLKLEGKLVRNTLAMVDELRAWVKGRRAQGESCSLCFSTFYGARSRDHKLRLACGRSGCAQRVCEECFTTWYGINQRGRLLNIAALSCPFCRRQPAPSALSAVGNNIHTLANLRGAVDNAGAWVYAWCTDCGAAKEYAERVCAQQLDGAAEHLRDWRCTECASDHVSDKDQAPATIKECPGCKTPTEKMSGCDHISCVIPGCGTHWCFFCGEAVSESKIYVHMSEAHGGWFNGDAYDDGFEWDDEE